ncbi:hypothetical protein MVEG_08824 [Podila verticillata NRRL 6337]|nr:hypothetical protein MVEG_08824 [Podila verticillata NRRL 6337]
MEQETRPLLASEDDHLGGSSSSISPEMIDADYPVDEMELREDSDASAEEAARFEALLLLPWYRRPSVFWLLPLAFVIAVVLGMSGAPQEQPVFTIGFYTSLSDRIGRKMLMYLTLIPAVFSQLFIVYMALSSTKFGRGLLYIEAFLNGSFGAGTLLDTSMNAYIVDSTPRDQRPVVFGYAMVAFSVGLIIGPAFGAFYIKWTGDTSSALVVSASAYAVMAVYCIILPESLPAVKRRSVKEIIDANEGHTILTRLNLVITKTLDPLLLFLPGRIDESAAAAKPPRRNTLFMIVSASAILKFAPYGIATTFIPYTNLVHQWKSVENLFFYTVMGAVTFFVYVAIFPLLQILYNRFVLPDHSKRPEIRSQGEEERTMEEQGSLRIDVSDSNIKDLRFFLFGAILYVIGYAIVVAYERPMVLFLSMSIHTLASVGYPSFISMLTSYVPVHQTGMALGGISVLEAITNALSSLLYGWIFAQTSASMPSAIYVTSTVLSLAAVLVILATLRTFRQGM